MSEQKGTYWLVPDGCEIAKQLLDVEDRQIKARDAWFRFCTEVGGKHPVTKGKRLVGIDFEGKAPEEWRQAADGNYFVPNRRSKNGRLLTARIKSLPAGVDALEFSGTLGFTHYDGGRIYFAGYERVAGKTILRIPAACEKVPAGCTRLKNSEYWLIVEAAEEAAPGSDGGAVCDSQGMSGSGGAGRPASSSNLAELGALEAGR
jgi:hypothetical protein